MSDPIGSDFGFLADPILNIKRSNNPTESYRIPGDGITSESVGVNPIGLYVGSDSPIRYVQNSVLYYS